MDRPMQVQRRRMSRLWPLIIGLLVGLLVVMFSIETIRKAY